MLEVSDLHVNYGPVRAVHGVSFSATGDGSPSSWAPTAPARPPVSARSPASTAGARARWRSRARTSPARSAHKVVRQGMVLVPEGRKIFFPLTVEENLRIGGYTAPRGSIAAA